MRVLTVAAMILLVLSGCAGGEGGGEQAGSAPSSSASAPSASAPAASPEVPAPSDGGSPPPPAAAGTTLTGVPEAGVEPGCVILRTDGQMYLLVGGDKALLQSGRSVTVTGRVRADLMTTCQQGTPFEVSEVRLA